MFELKPISKDAVPRAIQKAERYRLLNEPRAAESICRDVLAVDPGNQDALATLVLALTDQFSAPGEPKPAPTDVRRIAETLKDPYARLYFAGVVMERWAKAHVGSTLPGPYVFSLFREAMDLFEAADAAAPAGNDDALLRFNSCVRLINGIPALRPDAEDALLTEHVSLE